MAEIIRRYCPICKAPVIKEENSFFPFCGGRCKDADLYYWLTGGYKIPGPLKEENIEEEKTEDIT